MDLYWIETRVRTLEVKIRIGKLNYELLQLLTTEDYQLLSTTSPLVSCIFHDDSFAVMFDYL
jgi:hypothetical protein